MRTEPSERGPKTGKPDQREISHFTGKMFPGPNGTWNMQHILKLSSHILVILY